MKVRSYITKKDTMALYGTAVLLMVFHHMFYLPDRLNYDYVSVLYWGQTAHEAVLANFAKICVPIYAFVSGYGMYVSCSPLHGGRLPDLLREDYKKVVKSLFGFYKKYWLVFFIFVPMGFLWFGYEFHITEFIRSFLGELELYNMEWWYVEQYVKLLLLFPVFDFLVSFFARLFSGKKALCILTGAAFLCVIGSLYVFPQLLPVRISLYMFLQRHYLYLVFAEGYLIARYDLFGFAAKVLDKKWFKIGASLLGLLFVLAGRMYKVRDAGGTLPDIVFTPVLVFCVVTLCHECGEIRILRRFLEFMGGYSTYIWLTHTFFAYYYFQELVMLPKYSVLIYIWLLVLSTASAALLTAVYKGLSALLAKGVQSGYFRKTDRLF